LAYLYRHIRLDKNEPFYIGIGSDCSYKRANERTRRNKIWNDICKKTEYSVDILCDNLKWEEACEKEKEFIKLYGRINKKNGTLSNLTDGGDGVFGLIVSKNARKRTSETHLNKILSTETKEKISKSLKLKVKSRENIDIFLKASLIYSKSIRKKVLCIDSGDIFESAQEAAAFFGVSRTYICRQVSGARKNKFNLKYI
jgi:hypothetical protein